MLGSKVSTDILELLLIDVVSGAGLGTLHLDE